MIQRRQRIEGEITVILAANETRTISRACRSYVVISTTLDAAVLIGFDQTATKQLRQGICDSVPFDEPDAEVLHFTNSTGNAQTVVISTSFGTLTDNRFNLVGGTVPTIQYAPTTKDVCGRVQVANTATKLIDAGTKRGPVFIQNLSDVAIAIGLDNGVTYSGANGGIVLEPLAAPANTGGSISIDTNSEVWAITASGSTKDVRVLAVKGA